MRDRMTDGTDGGADRSGECRIEIHETDQLRDQLPATVRRLARSCDNAVCFDHVGPEPIPSRDAIIRLVHLGLCLLYPGYFIAQRLDRVNLEYYLGQETVSLFEGLAQQITLSIRHNCIRYDQPCTQCRERGQEEALAFIRALPDMRLALGMDVKAALQGDPAAQGADEIIFSYPGILAISIYRMAHQLKHQDIPLIPRIMSEYAHSRTGIDIHPGAHIGDSFFIDHGTGVVIGETTVIGRGVRLYQGVTLGALSLPRNRVEELKSQKRHPTIEDDVVIYAGATILGGETVIGARAVIGGNVWLTESVPPDTKVFIKKPELIHKRSPG